MIRPLKLLPKTSPEGPAVSRPLKLLPKTSSEGPDVIRTRKRLQEPSPEGPEGMTEPYQKAQRRLRGG